MDEDRPVTGRDISKATFRAMLNDGYEMPVEEAARTAGPPTEEVFRRGAAASTAAGAAIGAAAAAVFEQHRAALRRIAREAWDDLVSLPTAEWERMWDSCPNREPVAYAIEEWRRERDRRI